ncbi:MAG: tetratricopeptide repeat protein [Thermodesulfobacteriota bacterium]
MGSLAFRPLFLTVGLCLLFGATVCRAQPAAQPLPRAGMAPLGYFLGDPVMPVAKDWEYKAMAAFRQGDWPETIRTGSAALATNPRAVSALINRGGGFFRQGLAEEAMADWREALAIHPGNGAALYNLGVLHHAAGRLNEAHAFFDKGCAAGVGEACAALPEKLRPKDIGGLLTESVNAFAAGDYPEVLRLSELVLSREPENAEALSNRCAALLSRDELDKAQAACDAAIRADADFGMAYNNYGVILEKAGRTTAAATYYEIGCRRGVALGCANRDRIGGSPLAAAD